jgi:hypothetical protein
MAHSALRPWEMSCRSEAILNDADNRSDVLETVSILKLPARRVHARERESSSCARVQVEGVNSTSALKAIACWFRNNIQVSPSSIST